jgi:hypothetical protein
MILRGRLVESKTWGNISILYIEFIHSLSNNNRYVAKNFALTCVDILQDTPPRSGVEYSWDESSRVNQNYLSGKPIRLVLYSADCPITAVNISPHRRQAIGTQMASQPCSS